MAGTSAPSSLDVAEQVARVLRSNAETQKFIEEQAKLRAEADKLAGDRALAPWQIALSGMGRRGRAVRRRRGLHRAHGRMTAQRLRDVLALLRWSQRGLSDVLSCDDSLVRRRTAGHASVPLDATA